MAALPRHQQTRVPHPPRVLCGRVGVLTSLTGPIKSNSPPCLAKKQVRQEPALSAVEGTGAPSLDLSFREERIVKRSAQSRNLMLDVTRESLGCLQSWSPTV